MRAIDERGPDDSPDVQLSNFRFYQDRETGHLVVLMTRFCERGLKRIGESDCYRYEVELE
jgi:hypothetical protein